MSSPNRFLMSLNAYREEFRNWLARTEIVKKLREGKSRTEMQVLRAWQCALFDGGWIAVHWPVESGGRGLSSLHQIAIWEEIAFARLPQPPGIIGLEVVGGTLARYGTSAQRERWVPRLLSADDLWCQGFSEPEAGSDLASLRTTATPDGDTFVVSGQKIWTTMAEQAEWCAALVRTDTLETRHRGISYLAIDMSSPGVAVRPTQTITGDAEFCELSFTDVRVPKANLVGDLNAGWTLAMDTLANERGGYLLRRRAELEVMFEDLVVDARARASEGGTLDESALGRCRVILDALAGQARKTGQRMVDAPGVPSPLDSADKLLLTRAEQQLLSFAQDHLGFGRTAHTTATRWNHDYLYSRAASIYSGTRQIQRSILAERVLGLPKSR